MVEVATTEWHAIDPSDQICIRRAYVADHSVLVAVVVVQVHAAVVLIAATAGFEFTLYLYVRHVLVVVADGARLAVHEGQILLTAVAGQNGAGFVPAYGIVFAVD